jgi:hypothetical protein
VYERLSARISAAGLQVARLTEALRCMEFPQLALRHSLGAAPPEVFEDEESCAKAQLSF